MVLSGLVKYTGSVLSRKFVSFQSEWEALVLGALRRELEWCAEFMRTADSGHEHSLVRVVAGVAGSCCVGIRKAVVARGLENWPFSRAIKTHARIGRLYQPDGISFIPKNGKCNEQDWNHLHIFPGFKGGGLGWSSKVLGI